MKPVRLDKLLSNLGYGTRKEATAWARAGRLTDAQGRPYGKASEKVDPQTVRLDGEALDPTSLLLVMHKPAGWTCSHRDRPPLVLDLLPPRYAQRDPALSTVGRLDKDTTGILLLTDQGQLLHRLTSPHWKLPKVYLVETALPLTEHQLEQLSQGGWCLPDDPKPLAPATCVPLGPRHLEITLVEGRYHQVKRMFEAVDNPLIRLHRKSFAGLELGELQPGQWRPLSATECAALYRLCQLDQNLE